MHSFVHETKNILHVLKIFADHLGSVAALHPLHDVPHAIADAQKWHSGHDLARDNLPYEATRRHNTRKHGQALLLHPLPQLTVTQ
ncbi:hypothetical protein GOP47_0004799 [Adiantum capillus-veneris]|uniref:Uncharacterized protein n=1 Tax=Adiantum capillus-veneris TaxID=13818 RepID=A0A9D4V3Y0_ADICA|nr:hypothetical protein GOP47_0004799 [Adiantum capillus-veneris]